MPVKPGILAICLTASLCAGTEQTASGQGPTSDKNGADPFVGKWNLNLSRSKINDEMKVSSVGENKYVFDFGAGSPETIVLDGTDQPGMFGTTLAVSADGAKSWKIVRKQDGHTTVSAKWELSENGNTLTDHFTNVKPDGSSNSTDYVYKRTAGTAGLAGTWERTLEQQAYELQIKPYEQDGLSFIASEITKNIKFDGKDYPVTGANLPSGLTSSGRRVNQRTLELTDKVGGKPIDTKQEEVSPDGKTLTITVHDQGQSKPKIYVFERE